MENGRAVVFSARTFQARMPAVCQGAMASVTSSPSWSTVLSGALAGGVAGFLARDLGLIDLASAWIPCALLGALLSYRHGRPILVAAVGLLAGFWLAVALTPASTPLTAPLVRRDSLQKADAVVVLGSRLQADGEPTTEAHDRLVGAIELIARGFARRLVVTEMPPPAASHAVLARQMLSRLGVTGEVLAVGPVRRTRDEALAIAALCRERGWARVLMVTSPLHSRRGAACLEQVGVSVVSAPSVETRFDLERLDRPAERLCAFASALHEWVGLWYYERRGWIRAIGEAS